MPELPEVETVRASLARDLVGKKIKAVAVTNGRAVRRHKSAKDFRALVEGRSVKSVGRLGKNLVIGLDNGSHLVIHLGMTGQLLRAKSAKDPKPKHTHVVFSFAQGGELRYVDPRTFGELFVSTPPGEDDPPVEISKFARLSVGGEGLALRKVVPELAHLGLDPFEDQIGWDRFAAVLRSRSTPLKAVLTDQDILAGIGNIYADEILFAAGLRFDRPSESLSTIEIRRLHRSITEILTEAIKHGGTTLDDEQFVDPDGKPGTYQQYLQVYGREGLPCYQCRQPIRRDTVRGRATFYCEKCQA
jgi:formamidopyrimidine-DNA glycosylase